MRSAEAVHALGPQHRRSLACLKGWIWRGAGHDAKAQSIISKALKAGAQPAQELEALLAELQSGTFQFSGFAPASASQVHCCAPTSAPTEVEPQRYAPLAPPSQLPVLSASVLLRCGAVS